MKTKFENPNTERTYLIRDLSIGDVIVFTGAFNDPYLICSNNTIVSIKYGHVGMVNDYVTKKVYKVDGTFNYSVEK